MIAAKDLFEAHLVVANLDASVAFYRDVIRLDLAYATGDGRAAFFWVGMRGRAMLGIWAAGSAPQRITSHVAFAASLDEVLGAPRDLTAMGITPLDFDGQPTDEAVVICWMPAASVYFRDPDGHLLEYIAMLPDPPRPECGVVSWSSWQAGRSRSSSEFSDRRAG